MFLFAFVEQLITNLISWFSLNQRLMLVMWKPVFAILPSYAIRLPEKIPVFIKSDKGLAWAGMFFRKPTPTPKSVSTQYSLPNSSFQEHSGYRFEQVVNHFNSWSFPDTGLNRLAIISTFGVFRIQVWTGCQSSQLLEFSRYRFEHVVYHLNFWSLPAFFFIFYLVLT